MQEAQIVTVYLYSCEVSRRRGIILIVEIAGAKIILENPKRPDLQGLEVEALADTGSLFLCIPEEVRLQLQLEATSEKEVTTADGRRTLCPYVGPIRVRFENRECYVGGIVLGDEVRMGLIPMESLNLLAPSSANLGAMHLASWGFFFGTMGQLLFYNHLPHISTWVVRITLFLPVIAILITTFCNAPFPHFGLRSYRRLLLFVMIWYSLITILAETLHHFGMVRPGSFDLIFGRVSMYLGGMFSISLYVYWYFWGLRIKAR